MKKGAAAFVAALAGAIWWKVNMPPEQIARITPGPRWGEEGMPRTEFLQRVSKRWTIYPRLYEYNLVGEITWGPIPQGDGVVERLCIYEQCGKDYLLISEHTDMSLESAEAQMEYAYRSMMKKTTWLHRWVYQ